MLRIRSYTQLSPIFSIYRDILICGLLTLLFGITFSTQAFEFKDARLALLDLSSDSGSPIEQAIELFVFANSVFLARLSRVSPRMFAFCMAPLAGLVFLALASWLWSDFPWLTIRRASRLIIEVTAVNLLALTYRDEGERLMRLFFRLFAILTVANLALLAVPSISFSSLGFIGIHPHKLDAGRFFFFALPVFAIGIVNPSVSTSRLLAATLFIIGALLLPLTNSKTAFVCIPFGILSTVALRFVLSGDARLRGTLLLVYAMAALGICLVVGDMGLDTVFDKVFGDPTLTGRDDIWHFALDRFYQRPIFGAGFGAIWQTGPNVIKSLVAYNAYQYINQAHNGYVDILAHLGLAGLVLLIVYLFIVFIRLNISVYRYEIGKGYGIASYGMYLLLGSVIYNFTDSTYLSTSRSLWVMLVFVSTCATARIIRDQASFPTHRTFRQMKLSRARMR